MIKALSSFILGCCIFAPSLYANCKIHTDVLMAIANIEGHNKREVGYPYIISFNKQSDMSKLAQDDRWFAIDKRTIDCKSLENCVSVYNELTKLKIKNIDLGAFQINPIFHKYEPSDYFITEVSMQRACEILTNIKKQKGWSWQTLATYHSSTKKHNEKYQSLLKKQATKTNNIQVVVKNNKTSPVEIKRYKVNLRIATSED